MRRRTAIGCLTLFLVGLATSGRAGPVIYFQDTTVPHGGYGVLNVWLGSTTPATDVFNNYSFQLQINGPSFLEFAPNPSAPSSATAQTQNYGYLAATNYIFPGDSLFGLTDTNAGALPSNQANQQFIGFDQSFSYSTYSAPNNVPGVTLLASLVLVAASTNQGESYSFSVVPGSNTYFNQVSPQTGDVIPGTDLAYSVSSAAGYTGTVMIGQSIPEPASIVSALIGMTILAGFYGVRRLRRS